jgi:hypothetical protein
MATILHFTTRRPTVHTPRAAGAVAAIIIFPGVRYEKVGDEPRPTNGKAALGPTVRRRKGKD